MKSHIESVKDEIQRRDPDQSEFQEAVFTVLDSLAPVLEAHPEYIKANLLSRLVEPERAIQFRFHGRMMRVSSTLTVVFECSLIPQLGLTKVAYAFIPPLT
ncbi:hypothetical protein HMPREF9104_01301 [Lentilactobacillus kisonensis F0435]|uniref:Glutamate dehydrogenase n=1 Tax=Lentilactobacillus kisonensis F0435 TaxID=797516 RepID=H1LFC5_9LACO|nr:hypothetical protein HMPREF9104_01301 [Lentilactobacillus kisonensis F0435]